ncbi:MAG: A24 family peptidase [Saccharofermentans sp.]|nr:A24 family peptidase [Saccharofermentans sp.]
MTTKTSSKLINDLKSIPSPVFYIFAAVALFCVFFVCGFSVAGMFTALFLLLLVACACADINAGIVPDVVVIAIAVLGIVNFLVLEPFTIASFISHLIGAVCISLPMLLISLIVRGAFGGGDIKLMAAAGLYLGWQLALTGAFIGMFVSGFYGIYLLVLKKVGKKSKIKLAPFLSFGLSIAALFGDLFILLLSV